MGKSCAWCGTVLRVVSGSAIPASHALCQGCLEELQSALSTKGLRRSEATPPAR
ncbi:MAG TPA: hypothetical protein PLW10_23170 [Myxococcota bacterium]|nr:hypothetical protein [Myxococcales bacterium]HPG28552.1 hypothetical protein [Myxococcota bacterium]